MSFIMKRVHTNVLLINQIYVITLDYIYNIFKIVKERINYFWSGIHTITIILFFTIFKHVH